MTDIRLKATQQTKIRDFIIKDPNACLGKDEEFIESVIPPHQHAKILCEYDEWLYRERHLVEYFINKIKHFRRIFSRFEQVDSSFLGFLYSTGTFIWLR